MSNLKALESRREYLFRCVQILYDISKEVLTDKSKQAPFRSRYKSLEEIHAEYLSVQDQINLVILQENPDEKLNIQQLLSLDELYHEIGMVAEQLDHIPTNATPVLEVNKLQVRLSPLDPPKFDGQIENWQTFIDSYLPMIHQNQTITPIEKFHYLISCLSGSALSIAKGVPLTANNYDVVYQALVDRYQNKRVLATTYLDKICKLLPLQSPSLEGLSTLTNCLQENINALKALDIEHLGEFVLFYLSARCLDTNTRQHFEFQNNNETPTIDQLLKYLQNHVKILEISRPCSSTETPKIKSRATPLHDNNKSEIKPYSKRSFVTASDPVVSCPCCNMAHSIYKCIKFQGMNVTERRNLANDLKLCHNCLRSNHALKNCTSKTNCYVCGLRHSTLLHSDAPSKQRTSLVTETANLDGLPSDLDENVSTDEIAHVTCVADDLKDATCNVVKILGSAIVRLHSASGSTVLARALIDSCSHDSFITSTCASKLGLTVQKCHLKVAGLGQNVIHDIKGTTSCSVTPQQGDTPRFNLPLVVISRITSKLPSVKLPSSVRQHFEHLDLADKHFDKPANIDILLGVEVFDQVYNGQRFTPGPSLPVALQSIYGWIISGQYNINISLPPMQASTLLIQTQALENVVRLFWESEEPPMAKISVPEDELCEAMFQKDTYRDLNGRYVVPLMIKEQAGGLGDSHHQALQRFLSLEKRLGREQHLKEEYVKFMKEYRELGHMTSVDQTESKDSYLIPHHCVIRPDSLTTKLRVVFNASCLTSNGLSLNDIVYTGPKLQIDVIDIVTKFRLHAVVFTADVCKMYRQIALRPSDKHYQHILWRDSPESPLQEYELNTVTYGVSSSPYLALRTLRQLASDEKPGTRAAEVLCEETFVDDITTGSTTLELAITLRNDLIELCKKGQFELRKWSSNDPKFLADLPSEHCQVPKSFSNNDSNDVTLKILGIKWDPNDDKFSYKIGDLNNCDTPTKRSILSTIARIFDPLGWLSPLILSAKALLQSLWMLHLSWDDPVPEDIAKLWNKFSNSLPEICQIKLQRLIIPPDTAEIHLVGFCDGSAKGFGCCVYLIAITRDTHWVSLLIGKSKVAPITPLTVNRLELCGAALLARVLSHMHDLLSKQLNIDSVLAYTDSTTVLAWLNTPPHNLKTYVANRVVQILEHVGSTSWRHVSTHENPADCCSRGITCPELITHPLWWSGPNWFMLPACNWPTHKVAPVASELPELKPTATPCLLESSDTDIFDELMTRLSSFSKVQRVLAWCSRFIHNLKLNHTLRNLSPLSTKELDSALQVLVKREQSSHFHDEREAVINGLVCAKSIQKLSPFMDSLGLLRVGGRIRHSDLKESTQHPLLLPKKCQLSQLLIDHYHLKFLHCGPRALQSLIQKSFWIMGIKLAIRSRLAKCVPCFRAKPIPCEPKMGDLPAFRLKPGRCFSTIGVDFGGPLTVKESRRRNARTYKAYFCVFVCLTVKAVHLEAVTELSTEAFIAALDRFISRRGLCHKIISDCGTNFVGARNYLTEMYDFISENNSEITDQMSNRGIDWEFNPPGAPHFGGIFESGIRCTKYHLKRVVGDQTLTLEELSTVLTKTEAILNSRPLVALSADPSENNVLTPGHFLVGDALVALPEPNFEESQVCFRSRWQMIQKITQSFWRIWQRDYIHTLQQRTKWLTPKPDVKKDQLVLVVDSNLPPLQWRLARIEQTHPGADGTVRVVTLRTSTGRFKRPVVKICPLPSN